MSATKTRMHIHSNKMRTVSIAMTITNDIIITLFVEIFSVRSFALNNPVIKFNYTFFFDKREQCETVAQNIREKKTANKKHLNIHLSTHYVHFTSLGTFHASNSKVIAGDWIENEKKSAEHIEETQRENICNE